MVDPLASRIARAALGAFHGLGAVVLPSSCVICRRSLDAPLRGPICVTCKTALPLVKEPLCPRCGLAYDLGVEPGLCGPCRGPGRPFRRARSLALYEEPVRICLHALKFGGRRRLARVLGEMAAERWLEPSQILAGAAVVPVPLSARRRRERGYNQAELIARTVARIGGVPVAARALVKPKERPPQAGLSAVARRRNARAAYRAWLPEALRGVHLLLVDDVFTTGSTVESASQALLRAGAASVDVLTIGRVP